MAGRAGGGMHLRLEESGTLRQPRALLALRGVLQGLHLLLRGDKLPRHRRQLALERRDLHLLGAQLLRVLPLA